MKLYAFSVLSCAVKKALSVFAAQRMPITTSHSQEPAVKLLICTTVPATTCFGLLKSATACNQAEESSFICLSFAGMIWSTCI